MGFLTGVIWTFALIGLSHCYHEKTIYQYLIDNGYSSFVQLLNETNQAAELNRPGALTVFAPSNAAIAKLSPDVASQLAHNPREKTMLVKYHIVNSMIIIPVLPLVDHILTKAGQKIDFLHIGHSVILNNVTRVDPAPNNDIICNNGIVQPIDSVLIPPMYSDEGLLAVLVERDNLFQDFFMALMLNNLTSVITRGEYTLFAPTNAAFAEHADNFLHPRFSIQRQAEILYEVIKYHLVPGARYASMLTTGQKLFTLHGTSLNVSVLNSGIVLDNRVHVIESDIPASNGVIHVVDHLLFPGDLLEQVKKEYWAAHPTTPQTPSG